MVKDSILFALGVGLMAWQGFVVPFREFNWIVMAAGGIIAGVPGWMQLWGVRPATPTDGSSLPDQAAPSPLPPPSSFNV